MQDRKELYDRVTARIVADMEKGICPWVRPWGSPAVKPGIGLPENAATGKHYNGINILLLWSACDEFETQRWLTFNQARDLGGNVRKGEKGTAIYFADRFIPKKDQERAASDPNFEPRAIPFLRQFYVFNVSQCDGLPGTSKPDGMANRPIVPKVERAECLIRATGADFRHGGDKAFYVVEPDYIQIPPHAAFFEPVNYYRTAFHELGHWTGNPSRLNREYGKRFGDTAYAREELVAEMSSAFTCASLAIEPTVRHADYLGSWISVLKSDSRAIFTAASHASKASDFILAFGEAVADQRLAA